MNLLWIAVLLGIIEGLTEFLPISSTGHLIVTNELVGFEGKRSEVFAVFIQLGAILAVVWEFRRRLFAAVKGLGTRPESLSFTLAIALAFLPAAFLGLAFHDTIKEKLFSPITVGLALIVGAIAILVVERLPLSHEIQRAEDAGWKRGLAVGFAQCLALWPGFSRSAATILGGMGAGLSRKAATEFSFFLAIPTMFAATIWDLLQNHQHLEPGDASALALSFAVSFLVAWLAIRWLLGFVATHTLVPFAWYRLAIGIVILVVFWN
ncbi:MAG: undecaprenyl-diphosphate phosphatase [Myxococcota bacterium]